jgi:hypothetical protein
MHFLFPVVKWSAPCSLRLHSSYRPYLALETSGICLVELKSVAMISIVFKFLLALGAFQAFSSVSMVHGYPNGSGNCPAGGGAIAAAGGSHKRATSETGALSKRGTTFAINGANVKGGESYTVGSTLKWTLKTTDTTYGMRGVLIRVSFTGGDSYTLASSQLKDNALCTGTGVSGLTHKSSSVKKAIDGTMRFTKAGSVTVDITVVYRNGGKVSVNGYSRYKFTIK